jgi:hypothetical protein
MTILTMKQYKLANLNTVIEFRVTGSVPTSATITWLKDVEKPALGTNSKTVTVTNRGNNRFTFTTFVSAQSFWVKLNTEVRKVLVDNTYKSIGDTDRVLAFTGNTTNFSLYVPYCDAGALNVEIFTVDGTKLEIFSESPKAWEHIQTLIFTGYTKPRLCLELVFFNLRLKQGDGPWRNQDTYSSFYVRVSGMKNVIKNEILLSTIVDAADYTVEYLDEKSKTKERGLSWGCTIPA